ncbi:DUF5359 family protein [Priestia taiwanensis]|uniref:DUF5359 family protein n=1 Tax=Priestia taiwanensis TaxID=1347902 RepID=UPI00166F4AFA|nr:DUF5359 family protein [Priestia taiwanensis]
MDRILLMLLVIHFVVLIVVQALFAWTDAVHYMNKVTHYEGVMKEAPVEAIEIWKNNSSHR